MTAKHNITLLLISLLGITIACGNNKSDQASLNADSDSKNNNSQAPGSGSVVEKNTTDKPSEVKIPQSKSLSEVKIANAKLQSEKIWAKHGTKIMARVLDHQLNVFKTRLEELRKLAAENKLKEAVDGYLETIKDAKSNDSRLWTDLAELALKKKDLKLAKMSASRALWRPIDPRVRARSLQVLAQIAEKKGNKNQAAQYLRHASVANPKDTKIAEKLKVLGQKEAQTPLPELIGSSLGPLGPALDSTALCKLIEQGFPSNDKDNDKATCTVTAAWTRSNESKELSNAAVATVQVGEIHKHHILAIKTKKGWFAVTQLAYESNLQSLYSEGDKFHLSELEISQVIPEGSPEVVVRYTHAQSDTDPGINEKFVSEKKDIQVWTIKDDQIVNAVRLPYGMSATHSILSEGFDKNLDPQMHTSKQFPVSYQYEIETRFDKAGKLKGKKLSGTVPSAIKSILES